MRGRKLFTPKAFDKQMNTFAVQPANRLTRVTTETKVYIQERGLQFCVMLVDDSLLASSLGRFRDLLEKAPWTKARTTSGDKAVGYYIFTERWRK